ncbi:DUF29 family protein [Trinickia soli]|uniref:DUF29 family protein n=1 Tax=Trinickia soli TaxID=380675 RepID=UPI001464FA64|nr:DUF29 family protein [Trinickia soli]CAB3680799.1 hypothetical protein LMG24076_02420 [Trinickia soli]
MGRQGNDDSNISIVGHLAGHGALPNCSVGSGSSQPAAAYDSDFILWARDEAAKLRSGRLDCLDVENVAEELDALARSLRRELVDRLARLLQHLAQVAASVVTAGAAAAAMGTTLATMTLGGSIVVGIASGMAGSLASQVASGNGINFGAVQVLGSRKVFRGYL